jgi:hypothetical protein
MPNQITDTILMVRPKHFGFNPQTADSNAFQVNNETTSKSKIIQLAIGEFDFFVQRLRKNGVEVIVSQDSDMPIKPDAVFPNNWVTFHESGCVVLYPMHAPNRRLERSNSVLNDVFQTKEHKRIYLDLVHLENENEFLEGTGSLILDRPNKIAYACLSPRSSEKAINAFCKAFDYEKVIFTSTDKDGQQIYHTNVMMALGENLVVICMDSITDSNEKARLKQYFKNTGKVLIDITFEQMYAFAGNMLQVKNKQGERFLVMSEQAYKSLTEKQIALIEQYSNIIHAPLYTIEQYGGGSARCMMAEVFL